MTADIENVRAFILAEIEQRQDGGERRYIAKAQRALDAFERIVAPIEAAARSAQVRDFDGLFGPDAEWWMRGD